MTFDPNYIEPEVVFTATPNEPNRFDPFEALDKINLLVSDVLDHQHAGDPWKILGHTDALRAYITGMEK